MVVELLAAFSYLQFWVSYKRLNHKYDVIQPVFSLLHVLSFEGMSDRLLSVNQTEYCSGVICDFCLAVYFFKIKAADHLGSGLILKA